MAKAKKNSDFMQLEADMLFLQKEQPVIYDVIMTFTPSKEISQELCNLLKSTIATGYRKYYADQKLRILTQDDFKLLSSESGQNYGSSLRFFNMTAEINIQQAIFMISRQGMLYFRDTLRIAYALDRVCYPCGAPPQYPLSFTAWDDKREEVRALSDAELVAGVANIINRFPFLEKMCLKKRKKLVKRPFWSELLYTFVSLILKDTDFSNLTCDRIPGLAKKMIDKLKKAITKKDPDEKLKAFFADTEGCTFYYLMESFMQPVFEKTKKNAESPAVQFFIFAMAILQLRTEQHADEYRLLDYKKLNYIFQQEIFVEAITKILTEIRKALVSIEKTERSRIQFSNFTGADDYGTEHNDEWREGKELEVYDFDDDIPVYKLHVKLRGARVSADILIRADQTFLELHNQIFFAFDRWEDQSYRFEIKQGHHIIAAFGVGEQDIESAADAFIGHHMRPGMKCVYYFDDGNSVWEHDVTVSDVLLPDDDGDYPKILKISGKITFRKKDDDDIRGMD